MTKDIVSHAIVRARQTFEAPGVDVTRIRSHSGRHRSIADLKSANVPPAIGMAHARIQTTKVYDLYGQLQESETARALEANRKLKATFKKIYKPKS